MKRTLIALGTAVVAATLAAAHESGHPKRIPDAKDPIRFRWYVMENIGDLSKQLKKSLEGGDVKAMVPGARAIAIHATRIPELFPKGSTGGKSRAKPEIWAKWDEFVKDAAALRTEADELGAVATGGDRAAAEAQLGKTFGACKSCHEDFREPEKKKGGK